MWLFPVYVDFNIVFFSIDKLVISTKSGPFDLGTSWLFFAALEVVVVVNNMRLEDVL